MMIPPAPTLESSSSTPAPDQPLKKHVRWSSMSGQSQKKSDRARVPSCSTQSIITGQDDDGGSAAKSDSASASTLRILALTTVFCGIQVCMGRRRVDRVALSSRRSQFVWTVEMGYGRVFGKLRRKHHMMDRRSTKLTTIICTCTGTPYLSALGLSKPVLTLAWLAGPLSGLLMQPLVGAWSDRSESR